ncbi:hypothetical protein ACIPYS_26215 [Kitasatospora sp. NPDC089913]|uniref:hypothetical protein n=1 Tax=Streptomycetaceae TaxID=2062 RepID=UPI00087AD228|nr:hypothetical protein [Streptomyces sp. TLI_053]SDT83161.1 hypothetical protein SAMN05216371_7974 [Streptomyces sp. TLI_053]
MDGDPGSGPEQGTQRSVQLFTGSERPFDAEDLVMASGREPTPERLERARLLIEKEGARALERYLP